MKSPDEPSDGITPPDATVLNHVPAYALGQTHLAFAQAQSVLLANMVHGQQQQSTASSATLMHGVKGLTTDQDGDAAADIREELKQLAEEIQRLIVLISNNTMRVS